MELLPQEQRAKAVDTRLTRYGIDGTNLTREQKVQLIRDDADKKYRFARLCLIIAASVFLVCMVLAVLAYVMGSPAPPTQTNAASLMLRMEKEGEQIINTKDPGKGPGAVFEFTLANSTSGLAIIDSVSAEVLDAIEDKCGMTQALVSTYRYEATLDPDRRGVVPFAKDFKYAPGEVDRVSVNLSSEKEGYDYFIRIVVEWYDVGTKESHRTVSGVMVARFPAPQQQDEHLSRDEQGRRAEQQSIKIEKRLEELQSQYQPN